ncbi:hypothetical protein L7F22_047450 [Adiantum nelumboides]|nr:hypothetical protein [Adiantum nelumboides]
MCVLFLSKATSRRSLEKMLEKLSSSLARAPQIFTGSYSDTGPKQHHPLAGCSIPTRCCPDGSVCLSRAQIATHFRRFSSGQFSSLSVSSFGRPLLGWNSPEIWRDREDLQPCRAILDENLMKTEPTAAIIDGKLIAEKIRQEIAEEITELKSQTGGKVLAWL